MRQALKIIGVCLSVFIFLAGWTVCAARTIDNIKYPPLNKIEIPNVEKIQLDNGLTLYILEDHELPLVFANAFLAAGSFLDPSDKAGLGGITGSVMRTGGTARMSGDEIDEALEALGASVEVNIGTTNGTAGMNILSEYVDTGLEILADILQTPRFDQDKIDLAKNQMRTEISSRNDEPFDVCVREFKKVIYGSDSPYARQTEYATVNSIAREDMINFHDKYISPENVMLAVWGDFNKDEMIGKIKKYFGSWPAGAGKVPKLPEVTYEFKPGVHYIEKENITQSNILIGHIGGLTGDPDFFALTVANNVLGGSFGSRMFNEVRSKKGLAYSTGASFTTNIAFPGIYYNYVITKLESTKEAIDAVMTEIRRMQTDPPTDAELKRAKDSYLNSFVFNFDSKAKIINRMMLYDYFDFPQDFLYKVKENIEKVTAADVLDVAKRRFHPDEMHIVVVGIQDKFDQPLSVYGQVDQIDITIPSGEVPEEIVISEESKARGMELLNAAAEASGGIEAFKKVTSLSSRMDIGLVLPQGKFSLSSTNYVVFPDKSKEIVVTPMGEIVTVIDGETGWMQQAGNTIDLTSEQLADSKGEEFRNLTRIYQGLDNPQLTAVYVKSEEFNGRPADILRIMSLDGTMSFKLILDSETHLPVGKIFFGETIMGPGNLTQFVSNYKEISGLKFPFSVTIEADGVKTAEINVIEMKVNPQIPDGTFTHP
ncbi:MAG: pitrilysin family protein [Candidatus Zixiibacteriota bacterium]